MLPVVLVALHVSGCGGDDDTTSTTAASGTSGAQGSAAGGMTAKEFLDASIPDEVAAVQEAADANPACADVNTDAGSDFQVQVAIGATEADPGTPISELVANNC